MCGAIASGRGAAHARWIARLRLSQPRCGRGGTQVSRLRRGVRQREARSQPSIQRAGPCQAAPDQLVLQAGAPLRRTVVLLSAARSDARPRAPLRRRCISMSSACCRPSISMCSLVKKRLAPSFGERVVLAVQTAWLALTPCTPCSLFLSRALTHSLVEPLAMANRAISGRNVSNVFAHVRALYNIPQRYPLDQSHLSKTPTKLDGVCNTLRHQGPLGSGIAAAMCKPAGLREPATSGPPPAAGAQAPEAGAAVHVEADGRMHPTH